MPRKHVLTRLWCCFVLNVRLSCFAEKVYCVTIITRCNGILERGCGCRQAVPWLFLCSGMSLLSGRGAGGAKPCQSLRTACMSVAVTRSLDTMRRKKSSSSPPRRAREERKSAATHRYTENLCANRAASVFIAALSLVLRTDTGGKNILQSRKPTIFCRFSMHTTTSKLILYWHVKHATKSNQAMCSTANRRPKRMFSQSERKKTDETPCLYCGAVFRQKREWQKFCSQRCRMKHWEAMHPRIDLTKST